MTKTKNFYLNLDVKFHDRCKCNRHETRKTIVFIHTTFTDKECCIEENNWEVICRVTLEGKITWEYEGREIPERIMNEVIKMYSEEEIKEIIKNLPVRKKF